MQWCLAGLVGVVVLMLCSRWWLPSVVPAVLAQWDVQVGAVARLESGRWEVTDVRYAQGSVSVGGDVVEVPAMWSIAQAMWRGAIAESLEVSAGALTVTMAQRGERGAASEPVDVVEVLHQVREALAGVAAYVPALRCDSLSIVLGETQLAEVREACLRQWRLEAGVKSVHWAAPVEVVADLGGELWELQVLSEYLNLQASLGVSGDLRELNVERCGLSGPWGQLELQDVLKLDLEQRAVLEGAEFVASLDLQQQAWIPAAGQLQGTVSVGPDPVDGWDVRFALRGTDLSYGANEAHRVEWVGAVQGTEVTVERLQVDLLEGTEADRMTIAGVADWKARTLDLNYEVALGAEWLNAWLREQYFTDALRAKGRVFGSLDAPELEGQVEPVTLNHPLLHPVTVSGEVRSLSAGAIDVDLIAQCEGAEVLLDVAAQHRENVCSVALKRVEITDPELPKVELMEPVEIRYLLGAPVGERLFVEPVFLKSEAREIRMHWGSSEGFILSLRNVSSARLDRWLRHDFPLYQVDALDLALTQLQPKILGEWDAHVQVATSSGEWVRLDLVSQIAPEGVVFETLAVRFEEELLLSGALELPLRLQVPHEDLPFWVSIPQGRLSGEFTGQSTAAFAQWLSDSVGVDVESATLGLSVSGFLDEPLGTMAVQVEALDLGAHFPEWEMPRLADLKMSARIDADVCEVAHVEFALNDCMVVGAVQVPTGAVWGELAAWEATELDWSALLAQASGHVTLEDWQFEQWRQYFPAVLRRSGELNGELELKPGLNVSGRLVLADFALRPTLAYSMIDQIGAELELADRTVTVTRASARVGGSPVAVNGWMDGSDWDALLWEFSAQGQRVPLVRTNDLIVRSDVDLALKRLTEEAVPTLSGELNFTQSTYLVEFDPMAPRVARGPSAQPPYFSITTPAIADWEFDVVAKGDSFFRVRSPYFRALVSANLALDGSFEKPEITGGLRVDSGDILFPSVRMELDSGAAFIEPTRPNEVQLDFSGIAQVASYVITMEVEQTLNDPSVYFSSTPTLPNSEIVRLLATGGLSGGEVGAVGVYLGKGLLGVGAGGVDSDLADRLTVDVGESGGRDGGNTFGVQYRITDDLRLRGGYDIHDAHNIDLLWSIFKR